jgi:hypothetical protein
MCSVQFKWTWPEWLPPLSAKYLAVTIGMVFVTALVQGPTQSIFWRPMGFFSIAPNAEPSDTWFAHMIKLAGFLAAALLIWFGTPK